MGFTVSVFDYCTQMRVSGEFLYLACKVVYLCDVLLLLLSKGNIPICITYWEKTAAHFNISFIERT